ncbi:MAG: hypothetical protein V1664_04175 [Candidatus Uhrbacteria bacterium]
MLLFLAAQDIKILEIGLLDLAGQFNFFQKIFTTPEKYLLMLANFLTEQKISWSDLTKIVVVTGPGSFTSNRIIVILANALAFSRALPIIGLENNARLDGETLIRTFGQDWLAATGQEFVIPVYDRPPNITLKNKI